jgi:hypothetical protein
MKFRAVLDPSSGGVVLTACVMELLQLRDIDNAGQPLPSRSDTSVRALWSLVVKEWSTLAVAVFSVH